MMRILLVGNYALDNQTSMLRYAAMVSSQLVLRGHEVEIIQPQVIAGNLVARGGFRKWLGYIDKYILFPAKLRRYARGFDLVHVCDHSNSMYLPHTAGRPSSISCHDLLAVASAQGRYPEQRISSTGKVQQRWILKHLAAARYVVCVSAHTAHELMSLADKSIDEMTVIPNCLNYPYTPAPEPAVLEQRQKLGLTGDESYLLHVGGNHWYKNRAGVLRIFAMLRNILLHQGAPVPRLVMAGHALSHEMRDFIAAHALQDSVIETVDPSNEELRALYTGAAALLFPSLYEGFGWPLIEAQSCGCPVITSDRPPMTEVAGDAALFIDPTDEPGAAASIAAGFNQLPPLRAAGFRNVQRFHPDRTADQYEKFFVMVARDTTSPLQVPLGIAQREPEEKE